MKLDIQIVTERMEKGLEGMGLARSTGSIKMTPESEGVQQAHPVN